VIPSRFGSASAKRCQTSRTDLVRVRSRRQRGPRRRLRPQVEPASVRVRVHVPEPAGCNTGPQPRDRGDVNRGWGPWTVRRDVTTLWAISRPRYPGRCWHPPGIEAWARDRSPGQADLLAVCAVASRSGRACLARFRAGERRDSLLTSRHARRCRGYLVSRCWCSNARSSRHGGGEHDGPDQRSLLVGHWAARRSD
jgi:hypothetical protein